MLSSLPAIQIPTAFCFFQELLEGYEVPQTQRFVGLDWQELFGEQVIATAILDRLLHHCRVINIKGHSYRLSGHTFSKSAFATAGSSGPVAENGKKEVQ